MLSEKDFSGRRKVRPDTKTFRWGQDNLVALIKGVKLTVGNKIGQNSTGSLVFDDVIL